MYDHFECVLVPSADNIDFGPNIKKIQDRIICSYGYRLIYVDYWYNNSYKAYLGEDTVDKCLNDIVKEIEYFSKVIET